MSHFAKVCDGKVVNVIVAEQEFFDTFVDSSAGTWIQTSYNGNFRGRFAGTGMTYDKNKDEFLFAKIYAFIEWVSY